MREDLEQMNRKIRREKRKKARRSNRMAIGAVCVLAVVSLGVLAWAVSRTWKVSADPEGTAAVAAVTEAETAVAVTEPETTAAPEPVVKTLTLTAVGDCALGNEKKQSYSDSFKYYYDEKRELYFFDNVRSIFEEDDITIVNLESTLTTETSKKKKTFNIKGDPSYVNILTSSSVEVATLGNNHTLDYGKSGLQETKDTLSVNHVAWALDSDIAYYTTGDGLKVAVVSRNLISASKKVKNAMLEDVRRIKEEENVDLIVACCHWSTEKNYSVSNVMKKMARSLVDAGADLVVGHHPHVLSGVELYNGKVICYSLGNFCFGANKSAYDYRTAIYQQTFTFVDGVLQTDLSAKMIPARTSSAESGNNFRPILVKGEQKEKIISRINKSSEKLSELMVAPDGSLRTKSEIETMSFEETTLAAETEAMETETEEATEEEYEEEYGEEYEDE